MIRGSYINSGGGIQPRVQVGLSLEGIGFPFGHIQFLLDTGATTSCLHPDDAVLRMGVTFPQFEQLLQSGSPAPIRGVGGSVPYFHVPATYFFLHEDIRLETILGEILVAVPSRENRGLPSLLGWDVLSQFHLDLDWSRSLLTLEPTSPSSSEGSRAGSSS